MKKIFVTALTALWVGLCYTQIRVDSQGKIGLGTTSPSTKIDVVGNAKMRGGNIDIIGSSNLKLWADNLSDAKITMQPSSNDTYLDILPSYAPVYFGSSSQRFQNIYSYTVDCYTLVQHSDINTKENIEPIKGTLTKLVGLQAISFDYKKEYYERDSLNFEYDPKLKEKIEKERTDHFGFSAQEVQKVFPELVHELDNGLLAVSYIEFIPVIINGLKEQQEQINTLQQIVTAQENELISLKKELAVLSGVQTEKKATDVPINISNSIALYQNAPNPFNKETEIKFFIPQEISVAKIYIHDLNGGQIKVYEISKRGAGSIIMQGSELNSGMYTYTMVADDAIIDTKRMILTE